MLTAEAHVCPQMATEEILGNLRLVEVVCRGLQIAMEGRRTGLIVADMSGTSPADAKRQLVRMMVVGLYRSSRTMEQLLEGLLLVDIPGSSQIVVGVLQIGWPLVDWKCNSQADERVQQSSPQEAAEGSYSFFLPGSLLRESTEAMLT